MANTLWFISRLVPLKSAITPDKVNEILPDRWTCNSEKSVSELGVNYEWDLKKTIQVTREDYHQRGWI